MQLLSHTSGLGTYARIHYGEGIPPASLDAEFERYGRLLHEPGRIAEYSNLGYGLIGELIELRSGQPLSKFMKNAVFDPLGMQHSFVQDPGKAELQIATRYDAKLARLPALLNNTPGAGNAYASVHDLLRFGMYHLKPETAKTPILKPRAIETMRSNVQPLALHHYYGPAYYGLGWYVRGNKGDLEVWHEGGMPGASAILRLLPEHNIVVVALSNRTDANALTQTLADRLILAVQPGYQVKPLDPIAAYEPLTGQDGFRGRWVGAIAVDGRRLRCVLTLGADGEGRIRYRNGKGEMQEEGIRAMVNGNSLISGFQGRLPSRDISVQDEPLLLLKLLRTGRRLEGSIVAYSSPERLEYLLPFAIALQRDESLAH